MNDTCSFKLSHYKHCLELAKKLGYEFLTMSEYILKKDEISNKVIVLRHDIDHNLKLALNFADIEYNLKIKSTYFIRIHAKYSITELENYKVLLKLLEQGHELGIHHDCDFANLVNENPEDFFLRDKSIFEQVINRKIYGMSSHEPNKSNFTITDETLSRFNLSYQAYSDIFLKEMKYISDSSSRWREGCMCNHIKKELPRICILAHPIWWFDKSPLENY